MKNTKQKVTKTESSSPALIARCSNEPCEISDAEWREIAQVVEVREGWGFDEDEPFENLKAEIYGVKFRFVSGSPGYVGDLFILQGDALERPLRLIRENGLLTPLSE